MELEFSRQIFEKYSNFQFHEYSCSGSRVVPCGERDGRSDMTKLIAAFRNFANAPKNSINNIKYVKENFVGRPFVLNILIVPFVLSILIAPFHSI
jgi:hypothetical protein